MADITREKNRAGSLLSDTNRVEAPFIKVDIGGYTMGIWQRRGQQLNSKNGVVSNLSERYPNYIQSLKVNKINGTVNTYALNLIYVITENSDPNFFEKLFSSVSKDFKIKFTYGDAMMPEYVYREEEAIITKIQSRFAIETATIQYTVEAVSSSSLTLSGTYTFPSITMKPSDKIKQLLYNSKYHLTDVFKGMRDKSLVEQEGFIASDDRVVKIPTCTNMSILEYISFLVNYMNPVGSTTNTAIKSNVYSLMTFEDTTGTYGGSYFRVQKVQRAQSVLNQLCTYTIDIGYPSANVISNFSVSNSQNWSLFYQYNGDLGNSDYLKRIDENGNLVDIYSPQLTNTNFEMNENDFTWWTKVTQYPIEASLTLRGLLRPVVLMQYVKINIYYWGRKHILSGYYIITAQEDSIDVGSGYTTTLKILRVAPDLDI